MGNTLTGRVATGGAISFQPDVDLDGTSIIEKNTFLCNHIVVKDTNKPETSLADRPYTSTRHVPLRLQNNTILRSQIYLHTNIFVVISGQHTGVDENPLRSAPSGCWAENYICCSEDVTEGDKCRIRLFHELLLCDQFQFDVRCVSLERKRMCRCTRTFRLYWSSVLFEFCAPEVKRVSVRKVEWTFIPFFWCRVNGKSNVDEMKLERTCVRRTNHSNLCFGTCHSLEHGCLNEKAVRMQVFERVPMDMCGTLGVLSRAVSRGGNHVRDGDVLESARRDCEVLPGRFDPAFSFVCPHGRCAET